MQLIDYEASTPLTRNCLRLVKLVNNPFRAEISEITQKVLPLIFFLSSYF